MDCVLQAYPGWTMDYAEDAIAREQERGWPIRKMLLYRGFEAKLREIQSAERPNSGISLPQDEMALRVYKARKDANRMFIEEYAEEEKLDPVAVLAKAGVKAV